MEKDNGKETDRDSTVLDGDSNTSNPSMKKELSFADVSDELKKTRDELEHYRKMYDETLIKLKYYVADFDNFKKTIEKQNVAKIFSIKASFLSTVIDIREDFIRAIDVIKQQKIESSVVEGLDNILKNVNTFLEKEHVKEIPSLNKPFDPNLHEIIGFSYVDDDKMDENIITKEIRKGYFLDDFVLRPSLVEVSKKIIKNTDDNKDNTKGDET